MKKVVLLFLFSILSGRIQAQQSLLEGRVTDQRNEPLPGANVYLKNTYDGTSTAPDGTFTFRTEENGAQVLVVSFMGYETQEVSVQLPYTGQAMRVVLPEIFNKLAAVTITAGSFEASDEKKGVLLKPLDIATTAGATADIMGALNTLPGTQRVGESGRLFVRGGEDHETRTFIDGLWVQNPFNATASNLPARSRFSPFMFKGTLFSTGGYSAEYSQALSSALVLNTIDFPGETQTDISLMTVGGGLAHTRRNDKQAITGELSYTNLRPYVALVPQNVAWEKAPEALSTSAVYRYKPTSTGLLKVYATYSTSDLGLARNDDQTLSRPVSTHVGNRFAYTNASYRDALGQKWTVFAGAAYNFNQDRVRIGEESSGKTERAVHLKNTWTYDWTSRVALRFGAESFLNQADFTYQFNGLNHTQRLNDRLSGAFTEADIYLSRKLTARTGLRLDYSSLQGEASLNPRTSLAYKTGEHGQVSLAYGRFSQQVRNDRLRLRTDLRFEQATHYLANYQHTRNERTLRAEVYYKQYHRLIRFAGTGLTDLSQLTNGGSGYARGLDLFWRDRKTVKNADYWISYSFLDTRRLYLNFPQEAVPAFASAHNFSLVYKHFVPAIRTQIGATASYGSPRRYHNPNAEGFNTGRTPAYRELSVNAAFLYRENIILYASATNLLGTDNIFGYRFAQQPDEQGAYRSEAIRQGAPRFLFLGLFITLSKDPAKNQLNNL